MLEYGGKDGVRASIAELAIGDGVADKLLA
jgi:hypothetical protein